MAAACLLPSRCLGAKGLYQVQEIRPKIFLWVPDDVLDQDGDPQFSRAGNAGFIISDQGVVVVDTTNSPFHARELLYEIRQRTDAPVIYVIDTSSDGERMLGNEVFTDQESTIVSSSGAQAQMRAYQKELARRLNSDDWRLQSRMRGFHVTLPVRTFEHQTTLRVDGWEINLLAGFKPEGSAENESTVVLPAVKVAFLGKLFENQFFPVIGAQPVRRWIEVLRQLETWDVDVYVPAHGDPGSKKELADFRGFLEWLVAEVEKRIHEGKSLAQIKKEFDPAEFFPSWHAPERAAGAVEAVYRELAGGPPTARVLGKSGEQ